MSLTTREEGQERERPLPASDAFFNVATDHVCSRNLLVSSNVECASQCGECTLEIYEPKFVLRKPVLLVVSNVTKTLLVVKETPVHA